MDNSEEKDINTETLQSDEETKKDNVEETKTEDEVEKLKQGIADINDKYLRLYAEFDNYRRRTRQEHANLLLTASEKVITNLLPIIDDFARAFENIENEKAFNEGVKIINDKFLQILKSNGVTKIDVKCGDVFDENLHDAIVKQKTEDEEMSGKVINIIENGYKMHDKILRYAKVIVGA